MKKVYISAVAVLTLFILAATDAMASQPTDDGPFAVSINLSDRYFTGDDIHCNVTITNTHGHKSLYLLKRNTPLDDIHAHSLFTIMLSDDGKSGEQKPLRYDGAFFKRLQPNLEEFALILPGESLTSSVDLTTLYSLHKEGVYVVSYNARIVFTEYKNFTNPQTFNRQHLVSKPTKFQLLQHHTKPPKLPLGELQRQFEALTLAKANPTQKVERLGANGPISPKFAGSRTSSDESTTKSAYSLAYQKVQTITPSFVNSNLGTYALWFGSLYKSYMSTVETNYYNLIRAMSSYSFTFYFHGTDCKRNVFAYTYFNAKTIYLCSAYLQASTSYGHDTKYGTIVHEMTHAVDYTEDLAYGEVDIQDLAKTDPASAINNADNYEYYVEVL